MVVAVLNGKVEVTHAHIGKPFLHIAHKSYGAVFLLTAYCAPVFQQSHKHHLLLFTRYKHKHLGGKITTAERILAKEGEGFEVGNERVKQNKWDVHRMKTIGKRSCCFLIHWDDYESIGAG